MSIGDATTANRYYAARAAEYDDIYRKPERQVALRCEAPETRTYGAGFGIEMANEGPVVYARIAQ